MHYQNEYYQFPSHIQRNKDQIINFINNFNNNKSKGQPIPDKLPWYYALFLQIIQISIRIVHLIRSDIQVFLLILCIGIFIGIIISLFLFFFINNKPLLPLEGPRNDNETVISDLKVKEEFKKKKED